MSGSPFCVISVDDYLERPQTKAFLAAANANSNGKSSEDKTNGSLAVVQPVKLGEPTSSFHTAELNQLGQLLRIVPEYNLEGDSQQGWGGKLTLGERVITEEGIRWQTKRAAKDGLAKLGVEAMKAMTSVQDRLKTRNWAGLLHEYYARSTSSDVGWPLYTEYAIGSCFACTCTIPARSEPFGSATSPFPNKRAARASAAMEAMQFLTEQGLTDLDRTDVRIAKNSKAMLEAISNVSSYAKKVNEICPLLGLRQPQYRIAPNVDAPVVNILSGAAYFPDTPLLPGPVGTIRNIYGKKNAREECARKVYKVLMHIVTEKGIC